MTPRVPFAERGGALRGLLDLATGCYPAFLFGGSLGRVLPVFHVHDVTREWLEPRLQYLVENGYRTVTCDEIARFAIDGTSVGPRAVALTFDDGWASAWSVATPLLKQYQLTAILFAIPGRVEDETDGSPFVTWPQLREMHASGVWDIQSHTRSHAMIFSGDEVTGFVTPAFAREPLLERPLRVTPDALGTPLYLRRSRMSDARQFLADQSAAERCRAYVAQNGGARFFDRPDWPSDLETIAREGQGQFESDEARASSIRQELADGRALLNTKLGINTVRHVALPWGIAGDTTRRALAETGHDTAFAERPLRRRGVHAGDDRYGLMRLNGKFLTCLPGRGRKWFFTTV
jgi:peptidoglycan/xylan/chitin deacetylase (PgdA/CDA1 family)